jgi:hypothetical protein
MAARATADARPAMTTTGPAGLRPASRERLLSRAGFACSSRHQLAIYQMQADHRTACAARPRCTAQTNPFARKIKLLAPHPRVSSAGTRAAHPEVSVPRADARGWWLTMRWSRLPDSNR